MIQFLRQFAVREEFRAKFELAYGPGGAWSRLFAKRPGFRGMVLLRDTKNASQYLAVESWDTQAERDAAFQDSPDEYAALVSALEEWTERESEFGAFQILTEASVRPIPNRSTRAPAARHGRSGKGR